MRKGYVVVLLDVVDRDLYDEYARRLPAEEITIAEILKKVGYNTAHVGKWHQGDIEQAYPHNQGFDFAAFPVHQQVQLSLMTREAAEANNLFGWEATTQSNEFELDTQTLVDLTFARRLGSRLALDLAVQNLFDEDVQQHPGGFILRVIGAVTEKQARALHFPGAILKPVFGGVHKCPVDYLKSWCNINADRHYS